MGKEGERSQQMRVRVRQTQEGIVDSVWRVSKRGVRRRWARLPRPLQMADR